METFPVKLYNQLQKAEADDSIRDVLSWSPDGQAFRVHNKSKVAEVIGVNSSSYESVARQLRQWKFKLVSKKGVKPIWICDNFQRNHPHLLDQMERLKDRTGKENLEAKMALANQLLSERAKIIADQKMIIEQQKQRIAIMQAKIQDVSDLVEELKLLKTPNHVEEMDIDPDVGNLGAESADEPVDVGSIHLAWSSEEANDDIHMEEEEAMFIAQVLEPEEAMDGAPQSDLARDIERCINLIKEERHLVADELRQNIVVRVKEQFGGMEYEEEGLLKQYDEIFKDLEQRAQKLREAKENLECSETWKKANTFFSIMEKKHSTSCRKEDDGSVSIKIESRLEGSHFFEKLAVLREMDLYELWAPYCSGSLRLAQHGIFDAIGWFKATRREYSRDAYIHAIGCDSMFEDGSIVVAAEDLSCPKQKNKYLPPLAAKSGKSGRMTVRSFQAEVKIVSTDSVLTRIVANIDPNIKSRILPDRAIRHCMKHVCKELLIKMEKQAIEVAKDPIASPHAKRIRDDPFYQEWLLPKFRSYCNQRGWKLDPIPALGAVLGEE